MKDIMDKNAILSLSRQGMSIKEICRITGSARNTVRKYLQEHNSLVEEMNEVLLSQLQEQIVAAPTKKKTCYPKRAFTKEVEEEFYKIIRVSEERDVLLGINKQYLTATKLHKELRRKGFDIGLSTVTTQYRKYKQEAREAFIKQEYDPGVRAEYDFHQVKLYVEGKVVRYYQATIALPYSNYYFIRLYKNEKMESVVDSIVQFYNHCNGVCKEMVFDNMSTVVKRFLYSNKNKEYTEEILRLSNY